MPIFRTPVRVYGSSSWWSNYTESSPAFHQRAAPDIKILVLSRGQITWIFFHVADIGYVPRGQLQAFFGETVYPYLGPLSGQPAHTHPGNNNIDNSPRASKTAISPRTNYTDISCKANASDLYSSRGQLYAYFKPLARQTTPTHRRSK